tara:strand:+ start:47056 stop:47388 length:333 start_codon:yes stop_codon:yes gene_type:complete
MNIQANLPALNLVTPSKNATNRQLSANEKIDRNPSDNTRANDQLTRKKVPASAFLDQVESLGKSRSLELNSSIIDSKHKKSIQFYLDTQSLTNQDLRDELHEQLGVDVLA